MKSTLSAVLALTGTLIFQSGCANDMVAPETSEPLPVTVADHVAVQGEAIPAIHLVAGVILTVRVTTTAECATIVTAGIKRGTGDIAVVSHVSSNPTANCVPVGHSAVDYSGTIDGLAAGTYRVRVFEGHGIEAPKFIGAAEAIINPAA